ncbi:MAG: SMC-Scp complex subunit ScpB [Candidatus Methanomethylophilaceae archaeon]|nr:SMC-Scp complex subunit ScpB [Candidatus Methanomethylophilaceae archaeon]
MDARGAVEAILFTSPRPIPVREIAERTNLSEEKVQDVLQDLIRVYDMINSAIRIAKIGNDYAMALREEYTHIAETFIGTELTRGMMKTLATIAYNQPILQSELSNNIGARVYEDVPVLIERGLVHAKKVGQTKELTTTKKFLEYFGIEANSKDGIRKWIESMNK